MKWSQMNSRVQGPHHGMSMFVPHANKDSNYYLILNLHDDTSSFMYLSTHV